MKTFLLQVYDVGDGRRVVKADSVQDIAVGALEALRVLGNAADVPPALRLLANQWVEAFTLWIGVDHAPEITIVRGPGQS